MSAEKIIETIKKHSEFLITSHIDLEGDALGSSLALASLLRKLGKRAFVVSNDRPPSNCRFLSGAKCIRHRLGRSRFEVAFIIDCPSRKRIGRVSKLIDREKLIINIDHHRDNERFGTVNWVDPGSSSTGEMIYRLFKLTRTKLDRKDALNIYTAILTDTGSFRHANTTGTVFYICSRLLKLGIEPVKVYTRIYENNSVQDAALLAKMFSRLSFTTDNKVAWLRISRDVFKRITGKHEILDKVFDYAKSIRTVKVVLIFAQKGSRLTKLSLRSKPPMDVQKVALSFGGGGHKFASGCLIKASLREAERVVLKQVRRLLRG